MEVKFTPEQKIVNELFGREIKYIIPEYQRPYSWDCEGKSDKNNQVNLMWDDLYNFYSHSRIETYFLGSMVMIGNGARIYRVVDGQQRLTTLVLLFAAIKCFIKAIQPMLKDAGLYEFSNNVINNVDDLIFDRKLFGVQTIEKKVRIENFGSFNYDDVLSAAIECQHNQINASNEDTKSEYLVVAGRYFKNRDFFVEQLQKSFLTQGEFTQKDAISLNAFFDFIKNRVSIVRILSDSFDVAFHIFEILNNRGLPLSNKDLFRNFLLREFDRLNSEKGSEASEPSKKWAFLEENYDLRDDFLSRWVESKNARQQQYSAYNDLREIYDHQYQDTLQGSKVEHFYKDIEQDLKHYTNIVNATVADERLRAKLLVLIHAGNNRYTLNFLLALWRQKRGSEDAELIDLVNAYEIFILHKLLLGRFSAGPIYAAIKLIQEGRYADATQALAPESLKIELLEKIKTGKLDNDAGKLLISKWIWLQEGFQDDVIEQTLLFEKATLEHILPQVPVPGSNWLSEFSGSFRQSFTQRLGNMTLLTTRSNSAARNYDFARKKGIYAKSKLKTTLKLAQQDSITEAFLENRHRKICNDIFRDLQLDLHT